MAKKKPQIWYGISLVVYDTKITEIEVEKVTETRLYLVEKTNTIGYNRRFVNKSSSYEEYFPTREEAAAAKLRFFKRVIRNKEKSTATAKKMMKEFKEREGL